MTCGASLNSSYVLGLEAAFHSHAWVALKYWLLEQKWSWNYVNTNGHSDREISDVKCLVIYLSTAFEQHLSGFEIYSVNKYLIKKLFFKKNKQTKKTRKLE